MKKRNILLLSILAIPWIVSAEEIDMTLIPAAYLWELFCSIHSSFFFLLPLAGVLKEKGHPEWTFKKLFITRAILLLIITPFFPMIFVFDFLLIFVGPFLWIKSGPSPSRATTVPTPKGNIMCSKCGRIMAYGNTRCVNCGESLSNAPTICPSCNTENIPGSKFCKNCGSAVLVAGSPILKGELHCPGCNAKITKIAKFCEYCGTDIEKLVEQNSTVQESNIDPSIPNANTGTPFNMTVVDSTFILGTEAQAILSIINKELESDPENKNKTISKLEKRKTIATILYAIIIFIIVTLCVAYHTNIALAGIVIVVAGFIYWQLLKNNTIARYIKKEVLKRPDEKISYITSSILSGAVPRKTIHSLTQILIFVILIGSILFLYFEPHMIYEKQENGYALRYYTIGLIKNNKEVIIPEEHKGEKVIGIRGDVFKNVTSITKVTLPNTIREIRGGAFQGCTNLVSINLPIGIDEIHGNTFEECHSLESIVIPEGVTRIGGSAFRNCYNLKEATIPKTVMEIGSSAFRNTALVSVCISQSAYVNERAFKETYPSIKYYENNCERPTYENGGYYNGY